MPKTIAITPSWYWPEAVERVAGIPPYSVVDLCVTRYAKYSPNLPAVITPEGQMTFDELAQQVYALSLALRDKGIQAAVIDGRPTGDNLVKLLAGFSAGVYMRLGESPDATQTGSEEALDLRGEPLVDRANTPGQGQQIPASDLITLVEPAVGLGGATNRVQHSQRSVMAAVISMYTFLQPPPESAWLCASPIHRWDGLMSALVPLYAGCPVVLADEEDPGQWLDAIARHRPAYGVLNFNAAASATREAKREVKAARETLTAMLLTTDGLFDPGDRQRIGKSFRSAALTMFGMPETFCIFASHPLWYMDESVGIPLTNAHVVPSDPRSGAAIQTLWELVESAEVTVQGPSVCLDYEGEATVPMVDGRFRTRVMASSDANGMVYILPD